MTPHDYTRLSLSEIGTALDQIAQDAVTTFGALDARQLNWKPDETRWSVAQCFAHLVSANSHMIEASMRALDPRERRSIWQRLPFAARFLGRMLIKSQAPTATRKFNAPPKARPSASSVPSDIVQRFANQQREISVWMRSLDETAAARTVMVSPFVKIVVYSILDGCRLLVAHDHRHVEQARRVTQLPEFPR
jgi:hypothetical protein